MFHPIRHFITITKHRNEVVRLCFKAGIGLQGLCHDLSKYSPTEFIPGAKYYTGKESPNNGERRDTGMSLAWMKSTAHEKMTETTYKKLLFLLKKLAADGEKETLRFMRHCKELPTE